MIRYLLCGEGENSPKQICLLNKHSFNSGKKYETVAIARASAVRNIVHVYMFLHAYGWRKTSETFQDLAPKNLDYVRNSGMARKSARR
jgi:hypothetical protein